MVAPDYSKAKVYQLVSNKTADVYIGSTVCDLCKRLSQHKRRMNDASSKRMFVNDAIITIALLEELPNCKSSAELKARELFYITTMPCINKNKPFITDVKVVGGNKAEWCKAYRTEHADEIKAYRTEHADEIKAYRTEHTEEMKAYQTKNSEKINQKRRERYAKKKLAKLSTPQLQAVLPPLPMLAG